MIFAIYLSFSQVRPTTDRINEHLRNYIAKNLVRIPEGTPPILEFEKTTYLWEMETLEKEVVGVRSMYQTAFQKDQTKIEVTLEMEENGDASIFGKTLPALLINNQTLEAAKDPKKNTPPHVVTISQKPETGQTVKVTWVINKSDLGEETNYEYQKLEKIPLLKILYRLPNLAISLFGN